MRWIVLAVLAAVVAACGAKGWAGGRPLPEWREKGIRYWAESLLVPGESLEIRTVVGARNESTEPVEVVSVACEVYVRLHLNPDREGLPVWDQRASYAAYTRRAVEDGECEMVARRIVVEPGESVWLTVAGVWPERMGTKLGAGRYYVTAYVPFVGRTVALVAGEIEVPVAEAAERGS